MPKALARVYPCSFLYNFVCEIEFDAPIKGHHVYKKLWTPQKDDILYCKKDYRSEALDIDIHAVGINKVGRLVGHVLIGLSQIISYFFQRVNQRSESSSQRERRLELGLVVPGKYCARIEKKRTVRILGDQLKIIKEKYTFFSWQYEEQGMYYKTPVKN